MSDAPLRPCPFCGGEARNRNDDTYCSNEDCAGWRMSKCTVERWNTRADLDLLDDPRVKALVEAADEWAASRKQHVAFDGKDVTAFQPMFERLANAENALAAALATMKEGA